MSRLFTIFAISSALVAPIGAMDPNRINVVQDNRQICIFDAISAVTTLRSMIPDKINEKDKESLQEIVNRLSREKRLTIYNAAQEFYTTLKDKYNSKFDPKVIVGQFQQMLSTIMCKDCKKAVLPAGHDLTATQRINHNYSSDNIDPIDYNAALQNAINVASIYDKNLEATLKLTVDKLKASNSLTLGNLAKEWQQAIIKNPNVQLVEYDRILRTIKDILKQSVTTNTTLTAPSLPSTPISYEAAIKTAADLSEIFCGETPMIASNLQRDLVKAVNELKDAKKLNQDALTQKWEPLILHIKPVNNAGPDLIKRAINDLLNSFNKPEEFSNDFEDSKLQEAIAASLEKNEEVTLVQMLEKTRNAAFMALDRLQDLPKSPAKEVLLYLFGRIAQSDDNRIFIALQERFLKLSHGKTTISRQEEYGLAFQVVSDFCSNNHINITEFPVLQGLLDVFAVQPNVGSHTSTTTTTSKTMVVPVNKLEVKPVPALAMELFEAAKQGKLDIVQQHFDIPAKTVVIEGKKHPEKLVSSYFRKTDEDGHTGCYYAAQKGRGDIVKLFIDHAKETVKNGECPVCMEEGTPSDVYSIDCLHYVCSNCKPNQKFCPTCRKDEKK